MKQDYLDHLIKEYNKAVDDFEKAKKEAADEIMRMTSIAANEMGAAYASRIERITNAAARIEALRDTIGTYAHFNRSVTFIFENDRITEVC